MAIENAYDYLKWEYSRLTTKTKNIEPKDFDTFFEQQKYKYGNENADLYESNKILFRKLDEIASELKLPIEEQNRIAYAILNRHSENMNKVLKENNLKLHYDIVLGTLPINDLNAFVCPFPNGQMLLALNEGLIDFIYLMGRVVASFFTKTDEDKDKDTYSLNEEVISEALENNKSGHAKFIETLVLYFAYENLHISSTYYEKDNNKQLSGVLYDNAELFVVAHEYSHIILDHLSPNRKLKKRFLDEASSLYQIMRNWNDEYSADALAVQSVLANNRNKLNGWMCGYLGVELCISCLEVIERFYNIESSETHPSAGMRRANIQKTLKQLLPLDHSKNILDNSKFIQDIISTLWKTHKDTIYNICDKFNEISRI
ncbi:MAG: hypothetical protein K0S76_185 [Herbinix sp.]|jgi:hypothetical protein|nr:hypothetical protein [Herbinix sp.]